MTSPDAQTPIGSLRDSLEERRQTLGISYVIFNSLAFDDVGPIVAGLA